MEVESTLEAESTTTSYITCLQLQSSHAKALCTLPRLVKTHLDTSLPGRDVIFCFIAIQRDFFLPISATYSNCAGNEGLE